MFGVFNEGSAAVHPSDARTATRAEAQQAMHQDALRVAQAAARERARLAAEAAAAAAAAAEDAAALRRERRRQRRSVVRRKRGWQLGTFFFALVCGYGVLSIVLHDQMIDSMEMAERAERAAMVLESRASIAISDAQSALEHLTRLAELMAYDTESSPPAYDRRSDGRESRGEWRGEWREASNPTLRSARSEMLARFKEGAHAAALAEREHEQQQAHAHTEGDTCPSPLPYLPTAPPPPPPPLTTPYPPTHPTHTSYPSSLGGARHDGHAREEGGRDGRGGGARGRWSEGCGGGRRCGGGGGARGERGIARGGRGARRDGRRGRPGWARRA